MDQGGARGMRECGSKVEARARMLDVKAGDRHTNVELEDREGQGASEQLDRATEGGAKGLKGVSIGRAKELNAIVRGGGSGKAGWDQWLGDFANRYIAKHMYFPRGRIQQALLSGGRMSGAPFQTIKHH